MVHAAPHPTRERTSTFAKLEGEVEIHASFIGVKAGKMHKAKRERVQKHHQAMKAAVVGISEARPKGASKVRDREARRS